LAICHTGSSSPHVLPPFSSAYADVRFGMWIAIKSYREPQTVGSHKTVHVLIYESAVLGGSDAMTDLARTEMASVNGHWFARSAVALVWLYQGLWCKLLGSHPGHAAVVKAVPGLVGRSAAGVLAGIGAVEVALAVWVLSGRGRRGAAVAQSGLLVAMNIGGLLWGRAAIPDPGGMVIQNLAFLALIWIVVGQGEIRHARS
jgi:hypothetical protein